MLSHEEFASFGPNQRPKKKIIHRNVFQPSHVRKFTSLVGQMRFCFSRFGLIKAGSRSHH